VYNDGTGKFFIKPTNPDWTLPFSLEFGEMLYQLRSALDSCIYDAAILEFRSDPPPDAGKWQFIATIDPKDFKEAMRRMKNAPQDIMTIMKSMQGYAGVTCRADGKEFDLGKTLVILNDWARIDRHRRLHIAGSAITSGGLRIGSPSGVEYLNFLDTHLLETESEVARFKIRNFVPGMKISFQADFAFEVMIDESPRLRLQEIALAMNWAVCAVREQFEAHFGITR
jgi:hypothetical protein